MAITIKMLIQVEDEETLCLNNETQYNLRTGDVILLEDSMLMEVTTNKLTESVDMNDVNIRTSKNLLYTIKDYYDKIIKQ